MRDSIKFDLDEIRTRYRQERLGVREIAVRLGVSPWRVYRLMRQSNLPRRHGAEQNDATYKHKPQFVVKSCLSPAEEQLRIAGAMLYWAEGTKTGKTVNVANSDPKLIALFVTFLRKICGVAEERWQVLLYAYVDQEIERLKACWSQLTGIPLQQFTKPYIRAITPNVTGRKMAQGLVHIRYSDSRLLQVILQWTEECSQFWAGT